LLQKASFKFLISKVDNISNVIQFIKSVTVLDALRFILKAWEEVNVSCIKGCLSNAGFDGSSKVLIVDPVYHIYTIYESNEICAFLKSQNIIQNEFIDYDKNVSTQVSVA
jgi:hypothetical protein